MSARVLATPEAVDQVGRMNQVVEGRLREELQQLNAAADRLSDSNVWDGPHAAEFRGMWADIRPRLEQARADLGSLQQRIRAITGEILAAGGSGL
ncbi:MAG: pyrophosphorylase [Acidimicrobiales bacterium]